ncbi:MAG: subclass B1 metallo-beta-lactamase [Rhizobacter sp.]|nr:subclass B1 metallo-beta-lactamase [Chlorobiales bacterium]
MKKNLKKTSLVFLILFFASISPAVAQKPLPDSSFSVSEISTGVYVHTSYQRYNGAMFPSNGLIVDAGNEVVLIDTAWDTLGGDMSQTKQLAMWIDANLKKKISLCIVSHAHSDRIGGISVLTGRGAKVLSTRRTAERAVARGYEKPEAVLPDDTTFTRGNVQIECFFPGEGHTADNIVVWLPEQKILYGGCFVKSTEARDLGNLADANPAAWSASLRRVIEKFPSPKIVVPGHQAWDDAGSLQHTLRLLEKFVSPKK